MKHIYKILSRIGHIKLFTLVELIIVIVVLSVLSVVTFMAVDQWIGKSRDSKRMSDVATIVQGLESIMIDQAKYPQPEGEIQEGVMMGVTLVNKGQIRESVSNQIKLMGGMKDPKTKDYYIYGVTYDSKQYQIAAALENSERVYSFIGSVRGSTPTAYVDGNYKGVLQFSAFGNIYITNIPSLIFVGSGSLTGKVDLLSTGVSFVTVGNTNLPYLLSDSTSFTLVPTNTILSNMYSATGAALTAVNITSLVSNPSSYTTVFTGQILSTFGGNEILPLIQSTIGKTSSTPSIQGCVATTYSGYTLSASNPGNSQISYKSGSVISNGIQTLSLSAVCNGTSFSYGSETIITSCSSGYVVQGNSCVADVCGNTVPANATSTATSQTISQNWTYSVTPGICTFACSANYTWNGSNACTDQTAPTGGNFKINNDAATTTTTSVTLNITCPTDAAGSTPIQVAYGNTSGPTNWTTCAGSISHTLTSGDGTKTVYVRFRDSVSNATSEITDTITLNSTVSGACTGIPGNAIYYNSTTSYSLSNAPAGTSLTASYNASPTSNTCQFRCNTNYTWNGSNACTDQTAPTGGSFTVNNNAASTATTSVTLNITCPTDAAGSTPIQMAYGNSTSPTNWTTCASSVAHTLTAGDGSKTVYMRFRDSLANTTADVTDSINLISQANPSSLSLSHTIRSNAFTFSWIAGSGNGGSCKLQYYRNGSTWTDISATTYNCDSTLSNQSVTLPSDGWNGTWSSIQVRVIRTSDSAALGTFPQNLTCSTTSGNSSSTPNVDEDCNGTWNNSTSVSSCNTCTVQGWLGYLSYYNDSSCTQHDITYGPGCDTNEDNHGCRPQDGRWSTASDTYGGCSVTVTDCGSCGGTTTYTYY